MNMLKMDKDSFKDFFEGDTTFEVTEDKEHEVFFVKHVESGRTAMYDYANYTIVVDSDRYDCQIAMNVICGTEAAEEIYNRLIKEAF